MYRPSYARNRSIYIQSNIMKKIQLAVILFISLISQNIFAQSTPTTTTSPLLSAYFGVKNALVAGNSSDANGHALQMIEAIHMLDSLKVTANAYDELLVDATHISKSKDINHQREHFARLSTNMYAVAKVIKLSSEPIYYDYCPMKKSYWLSNNSAIKNPYYGSQMLTCGKVSETLK